MCPSTARNRVHTYSNAGRVLYVLHHVFSYLDPIRYSGEEIDMSRRSLTMAARTCRGFSGPALDVLWRRLPSDQPLANLLCTIGITERQHKQEDTALLDENVERYRQTHCEQSLRAWRHAKGYDIQYFLRNVGDPRQHAGWPRFVEYATRVRAICLLAFDGPAWCSLWEQLLLVTGGAPILPKLDSVAFCHDVRVRRALCLEALALVSPSVRTLNFNIKPEGPWTGIDEGTGPLFSQIFEAAPEIEQLRLRVFPFRLGAPFFRAQCSRLRHLQVDPPLEDFSVLTELPTLQYLSISPVSMEPGSSTATPLLTLKSVTTLVMNGRWTGMNRALGAVRLPSLRSLVLEGPGYDESAFNLAKGATECFRAISRHTSITSLSISATYAPPPDETGFGYFTWMVEDTVEAPLLDFMHPLLSLSTLRDVSISFPAFFILTSTTSDLRTIAESWPALEAFHLSIELRRDRDNRRIYQPLSRHPSRDDVDSDLDVPDMYRYPKDYPHGAPLEAIAHFARICPRLRVLALSAMEMSEDSLAAAVELLGPAPEPHGLRTLSVWQVLLPPGRKDLFEKVPELVGAVFPHVKFPFRAPRRGACEVEDDPEDEEWVYAYTCAPRHPVRERERKLQFWP